MSQSGSQGQALGSYYKTELRDAISSTRFRSIYQLPRGVSVNTKKIRLLNAKLLKLNAQGQTEPYVFGLGGSIECISKISVLSQNGVEIDRINGQGLRYLGMKNCLAPNGTQYSIMKELNGNLDLSVLTPDFSSVINGNNFVDSNGWWDQNEHSITINISSMLQYLGICRSVDDTGLQIMIEWNLDVMSGFGFTFDFEGGAFPQIAYDVYLDATKPDAPPSGGSYMFYTMIQDTFPLAPAIENSFQTRLTAFVKQYIANMYYMVASAIPFWESDKEDIALIPRKGGQLTEAPRKEIFQLFLDGKQLYSRAGITNSAMKQQFFNDYVSEANIPAGANCELVAPLGLTSDGVVSFGVAPINRFIGSELQIQYSNSKAHLLPTVLITIAEVLRSYTPAADMTAFVAPPPTMM